MKQLPTLLLLTLTSTFALADNDRGFFFGGGAAVTINDDCGSYCDTSGSVLEAGYQFNKIIGIEAKVSTTEYDSDSDYEDDITYFGANIGHTFNTSWVRLYGKIGHVKVKETDKYWNESASDSAIALGAGVSFTPFAHQSGFYIKLESISAEVFDQTIGYGQFGVGFQF